MEKEKWDWSWNGSCPCFMLDVLFVQPIKNFLASMNSHQKYALIVSERGNKVSAYTLYNKKNFEKEVRKYFDQNYKRYLESYNKIIQETNRVLLLYGKKFSRQKISKVSEEEIKKLMKLLVKNNAFYLFTQPEISDVLLKELEDLLKKEGIKIPPEVVMKLSTPTKTILNEKQRDLKIIQEIIQKDKNNEEAIFNYYWKYRSFFMINLVAEVDKEFKQAKEEVMEESTELKEEKDPEIEKQNFSNQKIKEWFEKIRELASLRINAKNTWINLALLIINLSQRKQIKKIDCSGCYIISRDKLEILPEREKSRFFMNSSILEEENILRGQIAYKGMVTGKVFIVTLQDNLLEKINEIKKIENPILVAEQTVPAYLPLIKIAKAIVTNEGGLLSHAAIVSREFRKPCIIGTKIATTKLKNNDLIELNADTGIVKILKKSK